MQSHHSHWPKAGSDNLVVTNFLLYRLSAEIVDYSNVGVEKKQSYVKREAYDLSSVTSVGGCYVEHISYKEPFGYEYASFANDNNKIGVCTGTVITPVTER